MIRKTFVLMCAGMLVISISACKWFSAKPEAKVDKAKPASNQKVEKPTKVDVIE